MNIACTFGSVIQGITEEKATTILSVIAIATAVSIIVNEV
jgi:hypothetical protein